MATGKAYSNFAYISSVSLNTLTVSGLFFCDSCTEIPGGTPWTAFIVEVMSVGTSIKQIARPTFANGFCFERQYVNGAWTTWLEIGRTIPVQGDTSTTIYCRKPGNPQYGSFIITGTAAGDGGVVIGVTINGGTIASIRNLMTNAAWSGFLTVTYGITNGVGYIGLKTTSSVGSNLCIVGG